MAATLKDKRLDGQLTEQTGLDSLFHLNDSISDFEPPIEIDLRDVFSSRVSIRTTSPVEIGELIGVDIRLSRAIYSVAGRVVNRTKVENGYWLEVHLEVIPAGMAMELEHIIERTLP